jgi:HlyD family secretion protein
MATVLGAAGCKKSASDADASDVAVAVKVAHPTRGAISEEIGADAVLAPLAQAAISPKISSPIREEYVQRGARVTKGQLLMTLESGDLQGSAMDSKGSLSAAEASYATSVNATIPEDVQKAELDLAQAKANYDVAARTAADRRRLFEQGALPGRDADLAEAAAVQARAAYETAEKHLASMSGTTHAASVKAAEGQLASAKGRYMSAEAQVGYASLRSPIAGVVTDRPLFPGETAVAGTAVITVMDVSSLLAKLHLAQAVAQRLTVGGDAEVMVPGMEDAVEAKVSFISPALDAGSTTVEVWLKLANADGKIKVGSPVHVVLHGAEITDALLVPVGAVVPAQDGGVKVMVVGMDNVAHLRAVKVGIRTRELVQITDGLGVGDAVIVDGSYGLDEGTKVTIAAKASSEDKD